MTEISRLIYQIIKSTFQVGNTCLNLTNNEITIIKIVPNIHDLKEII